MAEEDLELEEDATDASVADDTRGSGGNNSGRAKMILIGAVVAVLLGTNIFMVLRFMKTEPQVEAAGEETPSDAAPAIDGGGVALAESGAVLPLETLLVNLRDEDSNRFVRARVELVFATQEEMEVVSESPFALAKAQHVALSLLATKHSSELADLDGRAQFRQDLATELTKNLKGTKVVDVLLTDFIIQY